MGISGGGGWNDKNQQRDEVGGEPRTQRESQNVRGDWLKMVCDQDNEQVLRTTERADGEHNYTQ